MNDVIFPFRQPFRDNNGDVVVKKSETTIFKVTTIQVVENNRDYKPEELTPISNEEYQQYLQNDLE